MYIISTLLCIIGLCVVVIMSLFSSTEYLKSHMAKVSMENSHLQTALHQQQEVSKIYAFHIGRLHKKRLESDTKLSELVKGKNCCDAIKAGMDNCLNQILQVEQILSDDLSEDLVESVRTK